MAKRVYALIFVKRWTTWKCWCLNRRLSISCETNPSMTITFLMVGCKRWTVCVVVTKKWCFYWEWHVFFQGRGVLRPIWQLFCGVRWVICERGGQIKPKADAGFATCLLISLWISMLVLFGIIVRLFPLCDSVVMRIDYPTSPPFSCLQTCPCS